MLRHLSVRSANIVPGHGADVDVDLRQRTVGGLADGWLRDVHKHVVRPSGALLRHRDWRRVLDVRAEMERVRDRLYGERTPVEIDDDVRDDDSTEVCGDPRRTRQTMGNR